MKNSNEDERDKAFIQVLNIINEAKAELIKKAKEKGIINGLNEDSLNNLKFWFRGVSNSSYQLTPSLYRMDFDMYPNAESAPLTSPPQIPTEKELILLRAFFAREHFESLRGERVDGNKIRQTYAKMQHYGAPTRLLDWTESFGTALFFAINDNMDKEGRIYITSPELIKSEFESSTDKFGFDQFIDTLNEKLNMDSIARDESENKKEDVPSNPDGQSYFDVVENTKFSSPRLLAQRGHFTFTIGPPETTPECDSITHIDIPRAGKEHIKRFLSDMNIDEYTIYPDIIGLASYVKTAANLNPRKEFDAIRYFSDPKTEPAKVYLLKRANKTKFSDDDQEVFSDTHKSILSDAIYNREFVLKTIEDNIEDDGLKNDVRMAFEDLGKKYLGNIIFPFHLKKRAESFICEILGQHFNGSSSDTDLEYHHSSGLGSFDTFTNSINYVSDSDGNKVPIKQVITINNPADMIDKSITKEFKRTPFHLYHDVCPPSDLTLDDDPSENALLQALFASLDSVRKITILVIRLSNLPNGDNNIEVYYHPPEIDRPGVTYRASNGSEDCIIFLTARKGIPRPYSTFGLYLEDRNKRNISQQLREFSSRAKESTRFPANTLMDQIRDNRSTFLQEVGELLAKRLLLNFLDAKRVLEVLNREDTSKEIIKKCMNTECEAESYKEGSDAFENEVTKIVKEILSNAKTYAERDKKTRVDELTS